MPWYKRLRWRLIGSQFLVALVGVSIMMLATRVIIINSGPVVLRPLLETLIQSPGNLLQTEADLIIAFRNAVLFSVLFAALGANPAVAPGSAAQSLRCYNRLKIITGQ